MSRPPLVRPFRRAEALPPAPLEFVAPAAPVPLATQEVLGCDARLLFALPLASTLLCGVARVGGQLGLSTSGSAPPAAPETPSFVGPEFGALVLAAEHQRATQADVRAWCERKRMDARWRLTALEAIGGLAFKPEPRGWSVERVLLALGLELLEVAV